MKFASLPANLNCCIIDSARGTQYLSNHVCSTAGVKMAWRSGDRFRGLGCNQLVDVVLRDFPKCARYHDKNPKEEEQNAEGSVLGCISQSMRRQSILESTKT